MYLCIPIDIVLFYLFDFLLRLRLLASNSSLYTTKVIFFSVIPGFWAKESELWQIEHLLICQNCNLRVQQKKLSKKTREFHTFFTTSWLSTNKCWDIRQKTSALLKKLPFPSSEEFFAGNYFFEQLILF